MEVCLIRHDPRAHIIKEEPSTHPNGYLFEVCGKFSSHVRKKVSFLHTPVTKECEEKKANVKKVRTTSRIKKNVLSCH